MLYNPELSVRENAAQNGVSEAAVRKYIRLRCIDRRYDEKVKKSLYINKLREEHPDWSARRIAKELGIAPATVCSYIKDNPIEKTVGKKSVVEAKECLIFDTNTPIDFMRVEEYDSATIRIVAFSNGGFYLNGHSIGFSNMKTFPIDFMGHTFQSTETAYIACCYASDNEDCIRIQREIQASNNALKCKRKYMHNDLEAQFGRPDFHVTEWRFHLMLYLVWLKCLQHPEFREMLLSIPDDTAIVENQNGFKKVKIGDWGCKNPDALSAYNRMCERLRKNGMKGRLRIQETAAVETWNIGTWKGMNHQGKVLMACRAALRNRTVPCIDIQALNDANLFLFGERLSFPQPQQLK